MRSHWGSIVFLVASVMTLAGIDAVHADEQHQCFFESIQATFTADKSTYRVEAGCVYYHPLEGPIPAQRLRSHWSSKGSYDFRTGVATEAVMIKEHGDSGTVITTLSCPSDPWLNPSTLPGMVRCKNPTFETRGVNPRIGWFQHLREGFYSLSQMKVGPLPNSTGFPYNRASLIAQRDAALRAEAAAAAQAEADAKAAALARTNKRLQMGASQGPARVAPTILSPAASALFLSQTSIPIKLAPPPGLAVTGYLVRLESRNAQGQWILVTNLPVSAAEASSPSGYMGWGAPGPGRGQAMIAGPGTYRVHAQVSSPRQTGWSQPVEFVVTSPKKAIQKAPKMFGP